MKLAKVIYWSLKDLWDDREIFEFTAYSLCGLVALAFGASITLQVSKSIFESASLSLISHLAVIAAGVIGAALLLFVAAYAIIGSLIAGWEMLNERYEQAQARRAFYRSSRQTQ
jgi:hypothetical protein